MKACDIVNVLNIFIEKRYHCQSLFKYTSVIYTYMLLFKLDEINKKISFKHSRFVPAITRLCFKIMSKRRR